MNDDATSLDRLHDLAVPPGIPWWPLAPGWYGVLLLLGLAILWLAFSGWKTWRAKAYRRAALRELDRARDPSAIAEILRRTALAAAPRNVVVGATGTSWLEWLAQHSPEPLSPSVRALLTTGIYGRPGAIDDAGELHAFAAGWIRRHKVPPVEES